MKRAVQADIGLALVAIIWGTGYIAISWALDGSLPPLYLLAVRFIIAFALLALILNKKLRAITKEMLIAGLVSGFLLFAAFALQTLGLLYTSVSNNAFITAVNVVIVPFLYWILSRQRPDLFSFSACFITLAGIALLSLDGVNAVNKGDLLTLGCAFLFACHIVAIGHYTRKHDPALLTLLQLGFAGLFSTAGSWVLESPPETISIKAAGSVLYLAVFSTLICFLLQTICQKYSTSTKTAIILCSEALFGSLFAVMLLSEKLTVQMVMGATLIFVAVIIAETKLSFLTPFYRDRQEGKDA
ncbi:DMT family transporter [Endozoicomonas sp. Mp262]|uniref:DMT family transporter n=1 Tax=Endozoicomonas sp. Mp262 TaxID=2919499 RepID=UPI0021D8C868